MATDPSVYHARFLARVSLYVGDVNNMSRGHNIRYIESIK